MQGGGGYEDISRRHCSTGYWHRPVGLLVVGFPHDAQGFDSHHSPGGWRVRGVQWL